MHRFRSNHTSRRGFSLVEVLISTVVFSVMVTSMVSAMTFSARSTRLNTNAITAKNVAQSYFEMMAIDTFANINPPADGTFSPSNGGYADIDFDSVPPVWLDEALGINCRVEFDFKGYGQLTGGSSSDLTHAGADWEPDEWAGDTVYLIDGAGSGQFARISGNTVDRLSLASPLSFAPGASTKYMINNGKTVEITTTWQFQGKEYSQTIESLIINYRNEDDLGF